MNNVINTIKKEPSIYEGVLIGALLLRPRGFFEVPWLESSYFRKDINKAAFESIRKIILSGKNPDTMSVLDDVKLKFPDVTSQHILDYTSNVPSSTSVVSYANKLKRDYTIHKLLEEVDKINHIVEDSNIESPEDMMGIVLSDFLEITKEIKSSDGNDISEIIKAFDEKKEKFAVAKADGKNLLGWSTGFEKYDENSEGLQTGHLTILGGYTSSGKTFCALNILVSLLKQKARVKFISLEMSKVDILGRIISIVTGIDSRLYLKGEISEQSDISKIKGAIVGLNKTNLSITDDRSWDRIKLDIIKDALSGGIDVVFIDYLQMITSGNKSEYELTSTISQDLQQIAKDYNIHVVLLSQVNNAHAKEAATSDMHGFKGGGTIAASADVAIELVNADDLATRQDRASRGLEYNVDMIMKKNRHGKIGKIPLLFNTFTGQFRQQEKPEVEYEKPVPVDNRELPFDK